MNKQIAFILVRVVSVYKMARSKKNQLYDLLTLLSLFGIESCLLVTEIQFKKAEIDTTREDDRATTDRFKWRTGELLKPVLIDLSLSSFVVCFKYRDWTARRSSGAASRPRQSRRVFLFTVDLASNRRRIASAWSVV